MVDPVQLKSLAEKLSPEDRAALDHLMLNAPSARMRTRDLLLKDGKPSKTSVILVLAWLCGLALWVMQSLSAGATILEHVIPPFDSGAALAMLGAASSLYFATHNIKANVGAGAKPATPPDA